MSASTENRTVARAMHVHETCILLLNEREYEAMGARRHSDDIKRFITRNKKLQEPAAFMEKPVDRDELLATLNKLLS